MFVKKYWLPWATGVGSEEERGRNNVSTIFLGKKVTVRQDKVLFTYFMAYSSHQTRGLKAKFRNVTKHDSSLCPYCFVLSLVTFLNLALVYCHIPFK